MLDTFHARLRQLAKHCAFADADAEIKNQILLSTTSTRLRRYAMQHDLDLAGILRQGRLFEEVEHNLSVIEHDHQRSKDNVAPVLPLNTKQNSRPHHQPKHRGKASREPPRRQQADATCYNCGQSWPHSKGRSSCPARDKQCNACHKIGHFAHVCRSAPKTIHAVVRDSGTDSDEHVFMTSAISKAATTSPQVDINVDGEPICFTIDTGATVSVVSSNDVKSR